MNLFLIVWEYEDAGRECEWTHIVSNKDYLSPEDEKAQVITFMLENELADSKAEVLDVVENVWSNRIESVDGYKITLTKEQN